MGKRTAQEDITIDTTSDSQVNSNFPNRWSPASLTFNNYFYLFLYLYITWITTNNNAPHLKSPKNQSRRAALERPAIKITGGLQLVFDRPTLALSSALVPQTLKTAGSFLLVGKLFLLVFFFNFDCSRPQVIMHDIGYILHPSIEHFHNIPFSLFSLFFKSLRYYKLFCLAQAGTRRRNNVIQTSTWCRHLASTPISCPFDVV